MPKVGRWTLGAKIGSGGNANVYRAEADEELSAIKIPFSSTKGKEPYERFITKSNCSVA